MNQEIQNINIAEDYNFFETKKNLSKLVKDSDRLQFHYQNGEILIEYKPPFFDHLTIFQCIQIIKNHSPQPYIHTFQDGYYVIESNLKYLRDYTHQKQNDSVRYRFILNKGQNKIEIVKKSALKSQEISTIQTMIELMEEKNEKEFLNPTDKLRNLGVFVWEKLSDFGQIPVFEGYEDIKNELFESVLIPLNNIDLFKKMFQLTRKHEASSNPRAILLEGESGVGKTTLVKFLARLAGIPLIYVPLESFISKYFGESSNTLAKIYEISSAYNNSILFLDEIDSIAIKRNDEMMDANRKILSVILRKLDSLEGLNNIITIAASNRKKDLDPALISRFEKIIYFPLPDFNNRKHIFSVYAKQLNEIDLEKLSKVTEGFSCREIKDFCSSVEKKWINKIIQNSESFSSPGAEEYMRHIPTFKK